MINTLRGRLTAWYITILAATLVVFELTVYAVLARMLHVRIDDTLAASIDTTRISLSNDLAEGQSRDEAALATVDELSNPYLAVAVFDSDGRLMASRQVEDDIAPALPADREVPDGDPRVYELFEDDDNDRVRVAVKRVAIPGHDRPFLVHVSTPLEALDEELADIRGVLLSAIPAVLLLAGGAGWFMARKGLHPVIVMAERARAIGASNLDQRLPVSNPRDELGRLAGTFNELLERLSGAFTLQRQFMADASHELKTPLATIRAATDVTLQQPSRSESEYRDALRVIDEQSVRLTRLVTDMFTLAKADAGHAPLTPTTFYLDELLDEVAAAATLRGAGRNVRVLVSGAREVSCVADEELIRRLVTNLVDNALRYSPEGEIVDVNLQALDGRVRVTVTDRGPGIAPEAQRHLFERFYREDRARSRAGTEDAGAGLGLAIARWVAEAHAGTLELVSAAPGRTSFMAELPGAPARH